MTLSLYIYGLQAFSLQKIGFKRSSGGWNGMCQNYLSFFAPSLYIKYTGGRRGQRPLAKMTKYIINQTSTILIKKMTTLEAVIDHDQISKSVDTKCKQVTYHKSPYHKSPYHQPTQFCVQFWSVFGVPDHLVSSNSIR